MDFWGDSFLTIMIYTFGCSFTKWVWHTWSDWVQEYSDTQVINLGWPGASNEGMYWELMSRKHVITENDTVLIMLTGSNRVSVWYDNEWIAANNCEGFFPRGDGQLEFSYEHWRGMYRLHPDHDVSLTHMLVDNFNIIYQIQQLLLQIGCNYKMVFWQNPWFDVRPVRRPIWQALWPEKLTLSDSELFTASRIMQLTPVANLISSINWSKFYLPPSNIWAPEDYSGMWEYQNNRLHDKNYCAFQHPTDPHPDALMHHDFAVDVILGCNPNSIHRESAIKYAKICQKITPVSFDRPKLITTDFESRIPKLYD